MKEMNNLTKLATKALLAAPMFALALSAQDMPAGPGKEITEQVCGGCHGVDIVASIKASRQGWETIVDSMVSRGATATPDELKKVIDYLATSFPAPAAPAAKPAATKK
jgi:mono/diheme cytochrome c family protein